METPKLPWELESEILSRVPITSIKQLQLTCKRWYTLFKDPIFIKKHFRKAPRQMILKNDESVYSFSFSFHGIHNQVIEFTGKLRSLKDSEDVKISKIFQCESLFLCTTEDNRLVVWNPCTGQTRWILSEPSSNDFEVHHMYYLGYKYNNEWWDNYKILSWFHYYDPINQRHRVGKCEIYEFATDSWSFHGDVSDDSLFHWLGVPMSLKGDAYWLDRGIRNPSILRFDFAREKFERLPLPSKSREHKEVVVLSSVREEKLALLCQYSDSTSSLKMKIWVTDTKTDDTKDLSWKPMFKKEDLSWSEFLVVDLGRIMIDGMPNVKSFLLDEENKKVMCCDKDYHDEDRTKIYIVGEDTLEIVYREVPKGSQSRVSPCLFSYVPSLVQVLDNAG
ncbi:hypothetical protein Bca52824_020836 [Brassica carinata]|uniref:F-box domain-containing protein n=1 Tax=Brassica carinata TaxID=52824 RepID=A0A8X7VTS2_BRACI|nr:hypothetical protein Bca52824_020836 [Brassica carinata]